MEFTIIDSHTHWGPSLTLCSEVTTAEILRQMERAGVSRTVVIPFPSTAIANNHINVRLLDETRKVTQLVPYFYLREDFPLIPEDYYGGKWHWMRGVQDSSSNYNVLKDKALSDYIEALTAIGKPIVFEEELAFTKEFARMAPDLPLIIPHLGLLGGDPLDFLNAFRRNKSVCFDTALASQGTILRFVETIGPERVLFGSDIPFGSMTTEVAKVLSQPIPDEQKQMILAGNVVRLAKI